MDVGSLGPYASAAAVRSRPNSSAIVAAVQCAFRPLGLGSAHTRVAPIVRSCGPILALPVAEGRPVRGHADHREPARPQPLHLGGQQPAALAVLLARSARRPAPSPAPTTFVMPRPYDEQLAPARRASAAAG